MTGTLTYEAKLVPVDRWTLTPPALWRNADGVHTRRGEWEMFDAATFAHTAQHPETVPVDRGHRQRVIGRVTKLFVKDGWWRCLFTLDHPVHEHGVDVGQGVSIEFTPLRNRDGHYQCARLDYVSLVDRGTYPDARVVHVLDPADPALREPVPAMPDDLAERLHRLGVTVPKPARSPAVIEERDSIDPWLRHALEAAARRGTMIRPGIGYVTSVK